MAKYRVTKQSFINHALVNEGDVIEYDGIPGDNLEPMDTPAKTAAKTAASADKESLERQQAAAKGAELDASLA